MMSGRFETSEIKSDKEVKWGDVCRPRGVSQSLARAFPHSA